jgi:hypothetical protein
MVKDKRRALAKERRLEVDLGSGTGNRQGSDDDTPPAAPTDAVSTKTPIETDPSAAARAAVAEPEQIELPQLVLSIAPATSPQLRQLALDYWDHAEARPTGPILAWTHRATKVSIPDDVPGAARRVGINRHIATFCEARVRRKCAECGHLPLVTSRAAAEDQLRHRGLSCAECVERKAEAARVQQLAAREAQRELEQRRKDEIAALPQTIRGGIIQPAELSLAEALLLLVLTTSADDQGIIGPTDNWNTPPAKPGLDNRTRAAWSTLHRQGILLPHRSSPVTAFSWDDDDEQGAPYLQLAHWYVARGTFGESRAASCAATREALVAALSADVWPYEWINQVEDLAQHLVLAEGLEYFLDGLGDRTFPYPKDTRYSELEAAMLDAAADFSIGELHYLSWKPLQEAADAYRRHRGMTVEAATTHAINQLVKRAPAHRANGWQPRVYDQPSKLPIAAVTTHLFRCLGQQPMTSHVADLVQAANARMDDTMVKQEASWAAEERLLEAGPLPVGAWMEVLRALDAAAVPDPGFPGWGPPGTEEYFDVMNALRTELAASTAEYFRAVDGRSEDDQAQMVANAHAGAVLAAYLIARRLIKPDDPAAEAADLAVLMGGELQGILVDAYRLAEAAAASGAEAPF